MAHTETKSRLLMISSLERSGSTIFDLYLGEEFGFASFGEVERTLMPHSPKGLADLQDRVCTCGSPAMECPFWSAVIQNINTAGNPALTERYSIFLDTVTRYYGPGAVAVDSSKTVRAIKAAREAAGDDLRMIHLTRDVRGWVSSVNAAARRKKEISFSRLFQPGAHQFVVSYLRHNVLRRIPSFHYLEWALRNLRLRRAAFRMRIPIVHVSYDRLVLSTDSSSKRLSKYLGAGEKNRMHGQKHIVRGNRTAFSTKSILPLTYDWSWASLSPSLVASLLGIFRLNKRWVWDTDG